MSISIVDTGNVGSALGKQLYDTGQKIQWPPFVLDSRIIPIRHQSDHGWYGGFKGIRPRDKGINNESILTMPHLMLTNGGLLHTLIVFVIVSICSYYFLKWFNTLNAQ